MAGMLNAGALAELGDATLALGFGDAQRRRLLLAGLPEGFVARLPALGNAFDQLLSDVSQLNQTPTLDGHPEPPLHTWLAHALRHAEAAHSVHAATFRRHLCRVPAALRTQLPPPNPFFVGREPQIEELHRRLTGRSDPIALNQPAAAHGHGGVGKTEIAIAYGWRHLADWPGGVWMVTADGTDPNVRLARLADAVLGRLAADALPDDRARADAVIHTLASSGGALLIVDNLDDKRWFKPWRDVIPPAGALRLLVTTRLSKLTGLPASALLRVDRLNVAEGIDLLARYRADAREPAHRGEVEGIIGLLDGFAVALAAVGVYAGLQPGFRWVDYHTVLRERPLATLDETECVSEEEGEERRYRTRANAVFDDTLTLLAAHRPAARRALDHAAMLPEGGFPLAWLAWLARHAGLESVSRPGVDPAAAPGESLLADGLLRRAAGGHVALHGLLRVVVLAQMPTATRDALLDALLALGWDRGTVCVDAVMQPALRPELIPLLALGETLRYAGRLAAAARVVNRVEPPLRDLGRARELHDALTPLTGPTGHQLGPADDCEGIVVLAHLGVALRDLGHPVAACARLTQATTLAERHHGLDHHAVASAYNNLAMILQDLGDLSGARHRLEQAITIDERQFGSHHPKLAIRYSNLAMILQDLGDLSAARRRMEQAIAIDERHFETHHPALAASYSNLATILRDLGDLSAARHRMEQAITINERHFDAHHPTLAVSYNNLATILKDLGDLSAARRRMEQALTIQERHFDAHHPTLAVSYNNLAGISLVEGDRDAARALWLRALAIWESALPPEHRYIQMVRTALARLDRPTE